MSQQLQEAKDVLIRIQNFDVSILPREKDLGVELNFLEVLDPANRIISLYKQISLPSLEDFPDNQLGVLITQANADINRFEEILKFSQRDGNAYERHNAIIEAIRQSYQNTFNNLSALISYSTSKSADFKRLENEARAAIQSVMDAGQRLTQELEENKRQSEQVLQEVRRTAAEQGVSQQAVYFKEEFEFHNKESEAWKTTTIKLAQIMAFFAVVSLFIHKIPFLRPETMYDSIQLVFSKALLFAVISYMLYLSARNFLAHKHNAIINKHRQNALMTYKALVEAAGDTANKELVLAHASSCIFGPQATGYSRDSSPTSAPTSIVEFLTKPLSQDD